MRSILIIGCGSIGERHLRCFQKTGRCQVTACDTNPALLESMRERYGVPAFASLEEALQASAPDAAVVCTPAHVHLPITCTLLKAGLHVFIEKPLAIDQAMVAETRELAVRSGRYVAVAYVYHLMPWFAGARAFIQAGHLGRLLQICSVSGQHFPTFRPAYRDIYYARHETGGGAIQDALTHVANLVEWITGPCTHLYCDTAHLALEGVTVEDTVQISARHGQTLASYALNQFQPPNESTLLIHGEHGSLKVEIHERRWGVMMKGDAGWTWHQTPPMERDELFTAQALAFLDGMEGKASPLCTFDEAAQTLRFNEAALQSARTGQPVAIP